MSDPSAADFAWPAPAKLNLFLHVTGRRPNGYHELQTIFQFLDYGDSLYMSVRTDGLCRRLGGPDSIPEAEDLCIRAAQLLKHSAGCGLGADIRLEKRIPIGGGLGGGSSDAATTLVALNHLWGLGRSPDQLADLGVGLGADVPVFVRAQAAWAEGVGERLTPLQLPEPWYLVLTPPVAVSTREIFGAAELKRDSIPVTFDDFAQGRVRNDCEPVTRARHPEVAHALDWLQARALARMSGTGASIFSSFQNEAAARALQAQAPASWNSFVAHGLNRSPLADIIRRL